MDGFPKVVCTYKILPALVTALDYGYGEPNVDAVRAMCNPHPVTANSRALGPLLKIGTLLSSDEYATLVTPR